MKNILTIDIGGTFIKYAMVTPDMEIINSGKIKTPHTGREALVDAIVSIYELDKDIEGIGISSAGIIDCENGLIVMGGAQFPFNDGFHIVDELHKYIDKNIYIENDAKCAAMAEVSVGALQDVNDGFVLLYGTLIGGGYIKDRKVHHGKHLSAGEVSYIITNRDAYPDVNNCYGYRSGTNGLCKRYAEKMGLKEEDVDGILIFNAANNNEKEALEVLDEYTKEIAVSIFNIQTTLDPERFAIGGGISAQPIFIDYIKRNLDILYDNCMVTLNRAEVVRCKFGNEANLIGAASCYKEAFIK